MAKTTKFNTNTTSSNNPNAKVGYFSEMNKAYLKLTEIKESKMKDSYVYCRFELFMGRGNKIARYRVAEMFGEYPPFNTAIRDRFGNLVVYLKKHSSKKSDAPALQLQSTRSFNLTGLKFLNVWNIPQSRFAFGYPHSEAENKNGINPFYHYRTDGYLIFLGDCNVEKIELGKMPQSFELIIVRGGKQMISQSCITLANGGMNPELDWLRSHAIKKPILPI